LGDKEKIGAMKLKPVFRTRENGTCTFDLVDVETGERLQGVRAQSFEEGIGSPTVAKIEILLYGDDGKPYSCNEYLDKNI